MNEVMMVWLSQSFFWEPKYEGEERHLQCLDVLKLVSIPLFDLPVLPSCEEQMSLGDELEEHDAVEDRENEGQDVWTERNSEDGGTERRKKTQRQNEKRETSVKTNKKKKNDHREEVSWRQDGHKRVKTICVESPTKAEKLNKTPGTERGMSQEKTNERWDERAAAVKSQGGLC